LKIETGGWRAVDDATLPAMAAGATVAPEQRPHSPPRV
jgi:hypothetical protein